MAEKAGVSCVDDQDVVPDHSAKQAGHQATRVSQHIVEIVSDAGEGAQKAGVTFGTVTAKMGNGAWTVEIIPAEIKPPARSRAGASGIRIRLGSTKITNMGDEADLVVAFNEQVLYGRLEQGAYREGTILLLENKWAKDPSEEIRQAYAEAVAMFRERGLIVHELAIEEACLEYTANPRLGKNMFIVGMLCEIYQRDPSMAMEEVHNLFARKGAKVVETNQQLVQGGVEFARKHIDFCFEVPPMETKQDLIVLNGNQALGLGVMASGIEVVSMYPITPATSASHYLAGAFDQVGGIVHQAEDEIAAIGFAIGCSYAGKTTCTITSGPGLALKTEFIGLAVMSEVPLVIVDVQRGGPATGLPTKPEQADLLAAMYGAPGDAPKPIIAAATIDECFHLVITARRIAEAFRTPVILLTDAALATGVQPIPRPQPKEEWLAPPIDQSPWKEGTAPYDWDPETGISPRPIPGQRGGEYVLTGLSHTRQSKVAYDPEAHIDGCEMRSRKLAALRSTLKPPKIHGDEEGDLLVVGWGSTLGAIEEAVDRAREQGHKVSSLHIRFLWPLEPGLRAIFQHFDKILTVEANYSDPPGGLMTETQPGRPAQLALILRGRTRRDIDYWSLNSGQPLRPGQIYDVVMQRLQGMDLADETGRPKTPAAAAPNTNDGQGA
ncbi:MAG: 2-oxoacid:acceptor oxidoreductase subunit alpha [Planctomycetes bacterium]|nr:2-oxoacid:acceptor oxidoreductase subunit alpha [Planctomycetota bacterium]